jgi:hypothetical protein
MIRGFCGSIAVRLHLPGPTIGIRQIGCDPLIIADPSDLIGTLSMTGKGMRARWKRNIYCYGGRYIGSLSSY